MTPSATSPQPLTDSLVSVHLVFNDDRPISFPEGTMFELLSEGTVVATAASDKDGRVTFTSVTSLPSRAHIRVARNQPASGEEPTS